jgi:hypothetical protein
MEPLGRLLATDSRDTLQFFFSELRDVTLAEHMDDQAVLYNASLLAHFASTSTATPVGMPTPNNLGEVFDRFVLHPALHDDPDMMEMAAAQCLLLTGFFADQMERRHNLEWFGRLGASFYRVAAATSRMQSHKEMMARMAGEFGYWRAVHLELARGLRASPLLLGQIRRVS